MRRLVWMAAGAGLTIYVLRRSKAGLAALLPSSFSRALGLPAGNAGTRSGKHAADGIVSDLATGAEDFVSDFRSAMRTREAELRAAVLNESDPSGSGAYARRGRAGVRNQDWAAYDPDDLNGPDAAEEPIFEF